MENRVKTGSDAIETETRAP